MVTSVAVYGYGYLLEDASIEYGPSSVDDGFVRDRGFLLDLFAAIADNSETVRRMIEEGSDVNQVVGEGHRSPLLHALFVEAFHAARILIEHGANVLHKNSVNGMTPLHMICTISSNYRASEEERYEMCKLLLDKGAECNSPDMDGVTQLHYALLQRSLAIIKLLLDHGADITAIDIPNHQKNLSALHWAAFNPHVDVIEFVMTQGFDVEYIDSRGRTPLHLAALSNNDKGCEHFLKHGMDVNRRSNPPDEDTPLSLAVNRSCFDTMYRSGKQKTVGVLLEFGANLADTVRGRRILKIAAQTVASADMHPLHENVRSYADDIRFVLMRHVAKMDYMNIDECDRQTIENNDFYKGYYEFCVDELDRMKKTNIYSDVSVFNILMDSGEVISRYAENEELVRALESRDYDNEFPIYFSALKKKFYAEVEKRRL